MCSLAQRRAHAWASPTVAVTTNELSGTEFMSNLSLSAIFMFTLTSPPWMYGGSLLMWLSLWYSRPSSLTAVALSSRVWAAEWCILVWSMFMYAENRGASVTISWYSSMTTFFA